MKTATRWSRLVEEFLERQRRGEHPALSEYTARYPELAGEIRELFPVLAMVERFKPVPAELADPSATERPRRGARPTGGLPHPSHDRCWRDGDRLRSGARVAHVPGGAEGHAPRVPLLRQLPAAVPHRGAPAARLHHTNIVGVFDFGEHDGVCYYAMQYIAGHGLDVVLDEVRRLRRARARAAFTEPAVKDEVRSDRSRRTVALGLLTGQFAAGPPSDAPDTAAVLVGSRIDGQGHAEHPTVGRSQRRDVGDRPARTKRRGHGRRLILVIAGRDDRGHATTGRSLGSGPRSPTPWSTPTAAACSIATSSRPTSCWTRWATSG